MGLTKLGLPLDYKKLPLYFDALNTHEDTDLKNQVIENNLKKHDVKTVLDLTCGTGCQVFFLHHKGYQVTGADFSPALLEIARKRAETENIDVKFIDGDMRTIKVSQFDAVITIFNAVGHLTKAGFEKAMRNIHKNLKDGGIYVFDIMNLESMTEKVVEGLVMDFKRTVGGVELHAVQHSTINRKNGQLTSYDCLTIQEGSHRPKIFRSKFSLQIYTAKELKEMLARNGFETLDQLSLDGSVFQSDKTTNILMIAKKK